MRRIWIRLWRRRVPPDIDVEYHTILMEYSRYYANLNEGLRQYFRLRLFHLLNVLAFGSTHFSVVTREMRVVIGCAIIEITFGLDSYLPQRFTSVHVMPQRYMYPGYGEPFLGHIDYKNNMLYFSWRDVKHGYLVTNDAVNVALHEMAHVLEVEHRYTRLFSSFFQEVSWVEWAELAFEKMHIIRAGRHTFFKSYGSINMKEMFAVSIETFFEQPAEFKEYLPVIYSAMVRLLRQDPLLKGNPLV